MTTKHDDIDVDRYLSGNDEVSHIYKHDRQQAPARLDAKILAYAHDAVDKKNTKARPGAGFWIPTAIAASLIVGVVSFYAVQVPMTDMEQSPELAKTVPSLKSVPVTTATVELQQAGPVLETPQQIAKQAETPDSTPKPLQQAEATRPESALSQQAKADKNTKNVLKKSAPVEQQDITYAKKATSDNPLLAPVTSTLGEPDPDKVDEWYKKIEKLFEEGKTTEARKELTKFLNKYPRHEAGLKLRKKYQP